MLNVLMTPRFQVELQSMALLSTFERLALFQILHLVPGERSSKLAAVLKLQEYMLVARRHILDDEQRDQYCLALHEVILRDMANAVKELQELWISHGLDWDGQNPTLKYMSISIVNYIVDDLSSDKSEILQLIRRLESTQDLL